jgi:hypothetical protein
LTFTAEILPLELTRELLVRARQVPLQPVVKLEISFEEKRGDRFRAFLQRLAEANGSEVYFWTPVSNLCGVMGPLPLGAFNTGFPFDLNPEGIVEILTTDFSDQLLLDYSLGRHDEQLLEVEVSGKRWGGVAYGSIQCHKGWGYGNDTQRYPP